MNIEQFLLEFPRRDSTKHNYGRFLRYFNDWLLEQDFPLSELSQHHFKNLFLPTRNWSGGSPYNCWQALKAYLLWEFGRDYPCKGMHIYRPDPGPQRTLDAEEVETLIASIDTTTRSGRRDLPMVLLMLDTGLRAQEVVGLQLRHLYLKDRYLSVMGKGGRWRTAVFSEMTRAYLEDWLETRKSVAQADTKTVLCSMGGLKPGSELTKDGLRTIFAALRKRAGIEGLSPHVMRRTMATLASRRGAPSRIVQLAGGWSSIQMVQKYTQALRPDDFEGYFPTEGLK